jgi:cytochrome c5
MRHAMERSASASRRPARLACALLAIAPIVIAPIVIAPIVIAPIVIAGCASAPRTVPLPPELDAGRRLYEARCQACHPLHRPDELTPARWPDVLERMAWRARLSDAEQDAIERFLLDAAAR